MSTKSGQAQRSLVQQSHSTQLPLRQLCEEAGVSVQSLYAWRKKPAELPALSVGMFAPLRVNTQRPAADEQASNQDRTIEIVLTNGRIIRVPSTCIEPHRLRAIIEAVEGGAA